MLHLCSSCGAVVDLVARLSQAPKADAPALRAPILHTYKQPPSACAAPAFYK